MEDTLKTFQSIWIPENALRGGVVRNMAATPEGNLYLACSGKNRLAIVYVSK